MEAKGMLRKEESLFCSLNMRAPHLKHSESVNEARVVTKYSCLMWLAIWNRE